MKTLNFNDPEWVKDLQVEYLMVDALPIIHYYLQEMGFLSLSQKHVPVKDAETYLVPVSDSLSILVCNILMAPQPLYEVGSWLSSLSGYQTVFPGIVSAWLNDDRFGHALDALHQADRITFMVELAQQTIKRFELGKTRIHNDTTSVSFTGSHYDSSNPNVLNICQGYNKDYRPDLKQLVFGLNQNDEGVVISFHPENGNHSDSKGHKPNWEQLRKILQSHEFIYVADSKLASRENMEFMDRLGGKFITLLPQTRKEAQDKPLFVPETWIPLYSTVHSRKKGQPGNTYFALERGQTEEGFRLIWIYSTDKAKREQNLREQRLIKTEQALSELVPQLNRYSLKTPAQIKIQVERLLHRHSTTDLIQWEITPSRIEEKKQIRAGRPGPHTPTKTVIREEYALTWRRNLQAIGEKALYDGLFPLVTNISPQEISTLQVLQIYKEQPKIEKTIAVEKSYHEVAPMYLKKPERIEAMLFLHFVALMVYTLIQRQIRKNMKKRGLSSIPILPEARASTRPTTQQFWKHFQNTSFQLIRVGDQILRKQFPHFSDFQKLLLELAEVPLSIYGIDNEQHPSKIPKIT